MQKERDITAIKSGDQTRGSCGHFKDGQFICKTEHDTQNKEQPESKGTE